MIVSGRIVFANGAAAPGFTVRAMAQTARGERHQIGSEAVTDDDGAYRIEADLERPFPRPATRIALLIVVLRDGTPITESPVQRASDPETIIDLRQNLQQDKPETASRVSGMVRRRDGTPMDGVIVRVLDRDLRSEDALGTVPTTAGAYEVTYDPSRLRRPDKRAADIAVAVLDEGEREIYRSEIFHSAPADLRVDVVIDGAPYKGPSEWETRVGALTPLIEGIAPVDLREDEQFQDLTFLAGETGYPELAIDTWVACHRLADKTAQEGTPLAPEVFYAFLSQGQPSVFHDSLREHLANPERVALLDDKLLRAIAELPRARKAELLEAAVTANLVPIATRDFAPDAVRTLEGIRIRYAGETPIRGGRGTIGELLALVPDAAAKQNAFLETLTEYEGPLSGFWKEVAESHILAKETIPRVRLTLELGPLVRNHVPLVATLLQRFDGGEVTTKRDLARLSRAEWKELLAGSDPSGQPIGVPANVDGDTEEAKRETFATILAQQFERAYPTTAFAAKLGRAERQPPRATPQVARFLDQNPAFQLDRFRVDHFLAGNTADLNGIDDPDSLVGDLKAVQRAFKLSPTFEAVDTLLERGLDSAQSVYFMGQGQLLSAVKDTPVSSIEARKIYRRAENGYAHALALWGEYSLALNATTPAAVVALAPGPEAQAQIEELPNLRTLFGTLDYCECTHCRSVYSPAAYFVDLLRFLGKRGTQGTGTHAGKNVRDVLLERRPDLGDIELSCENTNTPVPYIDLVNEILEDIVAPPAPTALAPGLEAELVAGTASPVLLTALAAAGAPLAADAIVYAPDSRGRWVVRDDAHAYTIARSGPALALLPSRQTFLSAQEVRANPEHTNAAAYARLAGEVFPHDLPFDLWSAQVRAFLAHLGVPQARLLELFQQEPAAAGPTPSHLDIDCARLGITPISRSILTGTQAGHEAWDYWGLTETGNDVPNPDTPIDPTTNVTGTWIEVLAHVPVLLHRAGIGYRELLQLIDTRYVNPDGSIAVRDAGDANAAECDTQAFRVGNLTREALERMHRFLGLWRVLGCAMWELDALLPDASPDPAVVDKRIDDAVLRDISQLDRLRAWSSLDWSVLRALHQRIDDTECVDRSREGAPAVQSLYERLFRNRLVDAAGMFPAAAADLAGDIDSRVPGILAAMRISETDLGLVLSDLGLTPASPLDIATLSRVHRVVALARVLELSIDEVLRLALLSGADPFASPRATNDFVELVRGVAGSGLSVAELDYLLAHRSQAGSGVALEDREIAKIADDLLEGLTQAGGDVRRGTDEAYVTARLGQLPALAKDADQAVALAIIDGSWQGAPAQRAALIGALLATFLDPAVAKVKLDALSAGLSPADRRLAVEARFAYVAPELEAFLIRTQQEALARESLADVFDLEVPVAGALLAGLRLPGSADPLLRVVTDLRPAARPAVSSAMRLLHKVAMVITRLELSAEEVAWWIQDANADALGWVRPGDLPTQTGAPVAFSRWEALQEFMAWREALPAGQPTALDLAAQLVDPAVSSATAVATVAALTGWEADDITALATAFGWLDAGSGTNVVKARLRAPGGLRRLADCAAALRRLGVSADRALGWAVAEPTEVVANGIKQAIKSKYDLAQWQEVIRPLQDDLRERRRRALVGWLVARPDPAPGRGWSDPNGLYSHFLIDVEMSACMLTSRLKQASATAQLFVQRCLLGVEPDILASTVLDPKWKQWAWMRRYRVWEANRKVFLYPENWIEPELRDEKSPFFLDLEQELLQNDVTATTVEEAYRTYLEKLDRVACLEIRATFEEFLSPTESVLHVVGRARTGKGAEHYYRRRVNRARWTAWERIELDITSDHLLLGVHNRRLYLMWPQFLEKAHPPGSVTTPAANSTAQVPPPLRYWEVRLFWSERKKGAWTPKVLSDASLLLDTDPPGYLIDQGGITGGSSPEAAVMRVRLDPQIHVRLFGALDAENAAGGRAGLEKSGKQVGPRVESTFEHVLSHPNARYWNSLLQSTAGWFDFYFGNLEQATFGHWPTSAEGSTPVRVLDTVPAGRTFATLDSQARTLGSVGSFFLWDPARTYFVDYTWQSQSTYLGGAYGAAGTWHTTQTTTFRFFAHYHPFVELFIKELNIWGIRGLLNRRIQVTPETVPGSPAPMDFASYGPNANVVQPHPKEVVDFEPAGGYAPYNWELFFHVPFFIAKRLAANQRFEEALEWLHYIFDPTSTDTSTPSPDTPQQRFWITKPFYETTKKEYHEQRIQSILLAIAKGDAALRAQVEEWRNNPFNPHLIARMRTVAYQKSVLIAYVRLLIDWADQLFGQDTIESLNEATQLYLLADAVLGERPQSIPPDVPNPVKTYYQLQAETLDDFGNTLTEIENLLPPLPAVGGGDDAAPELPYLEVLYFCVPNNDALLGLWDTVADRLFKIRHCMNIAGVVRQLPLFEPPIDPAALVRAVAGGGDIGAALADISAPLPLYRFRVMIERARSVCDSLRGLGAAMQGALERRDAEQLALLRSEQEQKVLGKVREVRLAEVDEATRRVEALEASRAVIDAGRVHYERLIKDGWNGWEKAWLGLTVTAMALETGATVVQSIGSAMSLLPELDAGAAGFGASPTVKFKFGGKNISHSLVNAAGVVKGLAGVVQMGAGMTSAIGGYARRAEEWGLQLDQAQKSLVEVDRSTEATRLVWQARQRELQAQDLRMENAVKEDEYLRSKFTDAELYDWTVGQLSTLYFQTYGLAYDMAKRAERCLRFELGIAESGIIKFGSWDSLRKGLLAGERLAYDLDRLEAAYLEQNRREYEVTKHISLAQWDPIALLKLRQNGECFVDLPEELFDVDYPGHYFRRIKSVSLSIPCVAGPYTSVACTLTLVGNHLRKDPTLLGGAYARDLTIEDPRFRDELTGVQSIATSDAQNDDGLFELDFRDDRYLPFEGAGAISSWRIALSRGVSQIDRSTITDVVMHLSYTAREGGDALGGQAAKELTGRLNELALAESRRGLVRVYDARREFPDAWHRFLHPASPADDQILELKDLTSRLPLFTREFQTKKARGVELVAALAGDDVYEVDLSALEAPLDLGPDPVYAGLHRVVKDLAGNEVDLGSWTLRLRKEGAGDWQSLPADAIEELFLVVTYTVGD